ncbi:MAG TPA: HAD-IIB family hydrolase [Candidatus Saccharimonadales bacterium]|nr:HAD-IIB family hydrolase [Candidatus Saccharimonadales bacterium]
MKKVIVFDLDETLTETRSPITDEMANLLSKLLSKYQVCVISGGAFGQFDKQLLSNLKIDQSLFKSLHLMPTCGTQYYNYDFDKSGWQRIYAKNIKKEDRQKILAALNEAIDEMGYRIKNPVGPLIEDRGSQITYSAVGQDAHPSVKKQWDPSGDKKRKIRDQVATKIPNFEVKAAGTTSIDVTEQGMDKAFGMRELMKVLKVSKEEILFIGDRIWEGGNDYPVKLMGIDTIAVHGFEHTPEVVRKILAE